MKYLCNLYNTYVNIEPQLLSVIVITVRVVIFNCYIHLMILFLKIFAYSCLCMSRSKRQKGSSSILLLNKNKHNFNNVEHIYTIEKWINGQLPTDLCHWHFQGQGYLACSNPLLNTRCNCSFICLLLFSTAPAIVKMLNRSGPVHWARWGWKVLLRASLDRDAQNCTCGKR